MQSSKRSVVSIFELEQLEIRRFLNSASVSSSHVLTINGTTGNDTIILNQLSNGKVSITGISTQYTPGSGSGQFNQIYVNCGNGNDLVQINNNVTYVSSTISGSNGNDTLTGGKGNDSLDGGNDNDTLDGGGGGSDVLFGNAGEDLANFSYRTDNLNISLDGVANDGAPGEKDNVECEEVFAGSGNDTLTGSSGDDLLDGGAGNDFIQGGDGDDILIGSTGSDTLEGQDGSDYIQAKNQDVDELSGGTSDGDIDLASVDPQDIPVPGISGDVKTAIKPAIVAATQPDVDPTYGTNGLAYGPNLGWDSISAAAVDSQGRVIFVGTKNVGTNDDGGEETDMAVARYNADGSGLDSTFGTDGELDIDFTANPGSGYHDDSQANGVTIDSNDNIFVVGSVIRESEFRTDSDFALAKIDSNGQLDGNFGTNGTFSADLPVSTTGDSNDQANGAAVDGNGNIYLVGDRQYVGTYPSYDVVNDFDTNDNPAGAWSYGYSESLSSQVNLYDTTTDDDDSTIWSSSALTNSETTAPDIVYTNDGSDEATVDLDPGFYGEYSQAVFTAPSTGEYEVSGEFDDATDGQTTSDVHVLVNGSSQFDGSIDSSNGSDGFDQFFSLNAGDTVAFAVGYGSNQNFENDTTQLTASITQLSSSQDNTIAVAKVLADGSGLDTTYADGAGFNATNFTSDSDQIGTSIALTNGDSPQAVIGGEIDGQFLVAKYTSDGSSLDYSFGNGYGYTNNDGNNDPGRFTAIAIDSNNDIYAVGQIATEDAAVIPAVVKPAEPPTVSPEAVITEYDSNGNTQNFNADTSHTASGYFSVYIDGQGRVLTAGFANDNDGTNDNYLLNRFDSSLNPDSNFNEVETDFTEPDSGIDTAYGVRELSDGSIVAGGSSDQGDGPEFSAARYIVPTPPPPPGQIPDIEGYVTDDELQNPPPGSELAGFLDRLSPTALEIVQGEPSDNGYATINTGDGNDKVLITTVPGSANADIIAVNVNGIITYYDDQTTHHFYLNTNGGNDTVLGENAVDNFNLYVNAGSGNDSVVSVGDESVIQGGSGNDYLALGDDNGVLVGGSGNDTLIGSDRNDVLIGGTGKDSESGGGGEDIMIGGTTAYDDNQVALRAILDEWRSGDSRTTRVNDLLYGGGQNGTYVLRGKGLSNQTVFDDAAVDTLDGGADSDWFFRHTGSNADILKNSTGDLIDSV